MKSQKKEIVKDSSSASKLYIKVLQHLSTCIYLLPHHGETALPESKSIDVIARACIEYHMFR